MTFNDKKGFGKFKTVNTHFHYLYPRSVDETLDIYKNLIDYFEYDSICILSVASNVHRESVDASANVKGLYYKAKLNSELPGCCYLYGSALHFYDERDTADGYLKQAEAIYEMGCDGFKSLDGKPTHRKPLGRPLCDPVFDKMYGFLEEVGMPVKMHVTDPRKYWGKKEDMTAEAIARGWWYGDGSYPSFEEIHAEVREIMRKFPRLKLCLAHMGYLTDSVSDWEYLLNKYENTSYDLTPGAAEFLSFTSEPDTWHRMFEKYSDRIFFGTDTYNNLEDAPEDIATGNYEKTGTRHFYLKNALEGDPTKPFETNVGVVTPLGLNSKILQNVYYDGFLALHGEPRPVNSAAAIRQLAFDRELITTGAFPMPDDEKRTELENLHKIEKYFG